MPSATPPGPPHSHTLALTTLRATPTLGPHPSLRTPRDTPIPTDHTCPLITPTSHSYHHSQSHAHLLDQSDQSSLPFLGPRPSLLHSSPCPLLDQSSVATPIPWTTPIPSSYPSLRPLPRPNLPMSRLCTPTHLLPSPQLSPSISLISLISRFCVPPD